MDPVAVLPISDLPPGAARVVLVVDREVAVFNVDGRVHALLNECPHVGGPLGEGALDAALVTCPWHGWQFDVTSGTCQRGLKPATCVRAWEEDGWIKVQMDQ